MISIMKLSCVPIFFLQHLSEINIMLSLISLESIFPDWSRKMLSSAWLVWNWCCLSSDWSRKCSLQPYWSKIEVSFNLIGLNLCFLQTDWSLTLCLACVVSNQFSSFEIICRSTSNLKIFYDFQILQIWMQILRVNLLG